MVRAYHPQSFPGSLTTNTNYPPQIFDESGVVPPPPRTVFMDYENSVLMEYEDDVDMEYEG